MLEFFFAMMAAGLTSIGGGSMPQNGVTAPTQVSEAESSGADEDGFDRSVVPAGLVAEPQVPTGKFTTAAEVKPILNATKGNWIAVREYDGKDLLYITHLWAWRCGLHAVAVSVNGGPMKDWPLPACHLKYATPNAVLEEDGLPYFSMALGSIETVAVQVVYDDLSMDVAEFVRGNVLIP